MRKYKPVAKRMSKCAICTTEFESDRRRRYCPPPKLCSKIAHVRQLQARSDARRAKSASKGGAP